MTTAIGFVGLGHMGGAMAARLLEAGYRVHGTRRDRDRGQDLIDQGLAWCDTPREVAERVEVVFTSLPHDEAIESAASGPDGILTGLGRGDTWLDVSTVSPRATRHLAERARRRGATLLDAPVSGCVPQVRTGTLSIMVGGDERAYDRVEPILRELGTPIRVGESGHGQLLKLAVNISLAVQVLAFSEGLLLAERGGVDVEVARDVMAASPIGSPMLKARAPLVLDPPEVPWFEIRLMYKDIELALDAANEAHVPLPTASTAADILAGARRFGYGRHDIAALYRVLAQMSPPRADAA